ncbi:hypothetical protein IWW57_004624, partial [Coemansia sp. S610]
FTKRGFILFLLIKTYRNVVDGSNQELVYDKQYEDEWDLVDHNNALHQLSKQHTVYIIDKVADH